MKIGVVSDTHSRQLPQQMLDAFQKVDFIIHAGDLCCNEVYDRLSEIKKVEAVCGNMDGADVTRSLPKAKILTCDGAKIGICHGKGDPEHLLECVQKEFKGKKVDMVIFGHSHHPLKKMIDGVLYFNPGSPNDMVFAPYRSYGIIEINKGKIQANIIEVKDNG